MNLPLNNASAVRAVNICNKLSEFYDVRMFGHGDKKESFTFLNIHCTNSIYPRNTWEYIKQFASSRFITKSFKSIDPKEVKAVFVTSIGFINLNKLIRLSKKYEFVIIWDRGDVLKTTEGSVAKKILYKIDEFIFTRLALKHAKPMCVSTFILNLSKPKNKDSFLFPVVYDKKIRNETSEISKEYSDISQNLTLFYAGYPGAFFSKDRLDYAVQSFLFCVENYNNNAKFYIAGLTKSQFEMWAPNIKLNNNVIFLGKIDNDSCRRYLKSSHFSVLFRDDILSTKAGFPSKLVESVACETPFMTNATSDIDLYFNNKNSIIEKGYGANAALRMMERAFKIKPNEYISMVSELKNNTTLDVVNWEHILLERIER